MALRLAAAVHRARERLSLARSQRDEAVQASLSADYRKATAELADDAWNEGMGWEVEDAVRHALEGRQASVVAA
jgi:hypothetical protein